MVNYLWLVLTTVWFIYCWILVVSSLEKNDFLKDIFTHVSWYTCKKSLSSFPLASMFISNFAKQAQKAFQSTNLLSALALRLVPTYPPQFTLSDFSVSDKPVSVYQHIIEALILVSQIINDIKNLSWAIWGFSENTY